MDSRTLQDKVNIMVCIAAGIRDVIQDGRQDGRHLGFYQKFKFAGKIRKLQIFFAKILQCDRIKYFAAFGSILCFFIEKR